ncbi:hypothetical protein CPB85DRAFT_1264255 [Mucidula mucida]|nr:hypothetical protein CPB85DRAFT_1264255 [Mucidula mucida]
MTGVQGRRLESVLPILWEGNMGRGLSGSLRRFNLVLYPLKGTQAFGRVNVRAERFVKKAQASQAGGVVNTLRECSTYTVGVINMGRGLRDVDGESMYSSTGSSHVLYPLKGSQAFGPVNVRAERFVKTVQTLTASPVRFNEVKSCTIPVEGQSSWWCGQCRRLESVLPILWERVTWDEG